MPAEDPLEEAIASLAAGLRSALRENPELREAARAFAYALLDAAELEGGVSPDEAPPEEPPSTSARTGPPIDIAEVRIGQMQEPAEGRTVVFTRGGLDAVAAAAQDAAPQAPASVEPRHLGRLASAFELKAEATEWALRRMHLIESGADFTTDIQPQDQDFWARADRIGNCFLWMLHPFAPEPGSEDAWELLAETFRNAAGAFSAMASADTDAGREQGQWEEAIDLAAEAQSAVRVATRGVGQGFDPTQQEAFETLKQIAGRESIYIHRYMRKDDLAEPLAWHALRERIERFEESLFSGERMRKERKALLNKVRYHVKKGRSDTGELNESDARTIAESVERYVETGVPESSVDLREILLGVVDSFPYLEEDFPVFERVLRSIDQYLSRSPVESRVRTTRTQASETGEARNLLQGKAAVLIGGLERKEAKRALCQQLGLADLLWLRSQPHESINSFKPYIERPEVAVVLLAIRWSSHSFGEVSAYCEELGKPLVRLPAGYHPNQVAAQVMAQASGQLQQRQGE